MRTVLAVFTVTTLSGCLSPIALNRAVELYDQAAIQSESKLLLVNLARAQHHEPIHFTRVSSIAATFSFSANAGATPALTGERGGLLAPVFGGGVSENPTFSIDPIAGDEFTKRLLTPFSQHKLMLLLRQHYDIDLMLRMMAQEVHLHDPEPYPAARGIPPAADGRGHHPRRLHCDAKKEDWEGGGRKVGKSDRIAADRPALQAGGRRFDPVILHHRPVSG